MTSLGADAGAAAWTVTPVASTSNGGLSMRVTGAASITIKWVADPQTVEVVG